jgi:hypothetical protein
MASSLRMLQLGILWLVTMSVLGYLAYIGGVWMKAINDFIMTFVFNDYIASQVGISWWFEPLYYVVISLVAIAATWRIYQEVIAETVYQPELPPF